MKIAADILVDIIIRKYFYVAHCLIFITDYNNTVEIRTNLPVINVNVFSSHVSSQSKLIFNYFGCQGIVIKANKPGMILKELEEEMKIHMDRFNTRKYLIILDEKSLDDLPDVLHKNVTKFVSDIVVIQSEKRKNVKKAGFSILHNDNSFSLWTHNYVGHRNNEDIYLLDRWFAQNRSFMYNNVLYPNKLKTQEGRSLKVATFNYEPYAIIDEHTRKIYGTELKGMEMFATKLDMTMTPIVNPEDYWGEIFENGTGNGLMGNIVSDNADLGVAALYTWESAYHYMDLSKPMVRTGISCLVPAPKLMASWLTLLHSYSKEMWIAVAVAFFFCILTLALFNIHPVPWRRTSNFDQSRLTIIHKAFFTIGKVFILQNVAGMEMPSGIHGRILIAMVFLLNLFLSAAYSSGLSSIMTLPRYEQPIDTVKDLVRSGLPWGGTQNAWKSSIENSDEPDYKTLVSRFIATSEENLRKYSLDGTIAVALERLPRENFAIGTYIKADVIPHLHLMKDDLYWEQCVVLTRKNSILLPQLDDFILKVFEAGLFSYWQNEAVSLYMDSTVQKATKYKNSYANEKNIVKLKMVHLEGAFGILFGGFIIASITFLLEILKATLNK